MKYSVKLVMLLLLTIIIISVNADPQTIIIKGWTSRGFAPDLVNYTIPILADSGNDLRVLENLRVFVERLASDEVLFRRFQP